MKPKDLKKMFEAETDYKSRCWNGGEDFKDGDGQWITECDFQWEYIQWLEKFTCKVCENLDIAESVMYPFPKPK